MLNKLTTFIRQYDMVKSGDTLVCAVSGGADSVALLFAMYLLKDKLGITLEAAHFNHHLRGEESQRDEDFVRESIPAEDLLGMIHYNTEVIDADRQGKSPYDFSSTVVDEIRQIKAILDKE